ncbi:2-oxoisovalerate dehydrogenase E2 component (dihydrolipoyl transacylase) [Arthrobacter woluwensis]|uniref:dihydrolipoamide acetyltransferase family protein n=1 Tax=Arthrobacter woluwensis TaxID=156980 RepID=UPI0027872D50|nr:dihydrolipoamide acetyltransferase family protein [Arthrobacter woluwensis]MDQ0708216.1 2-oxoisovalerate dehydrogenase E2 component (dihydrolipoyl transacylase) [Arthrobacter woluwensis]
MIKVFNLPDLGEGLTESEVVAWKVAPGQAVALNEIIAEVETAKAVVELPSPFTGTISALHADPGTVVEVGHPLVSFDVIGADDDVAQPPQREANLVGYGALVEKGGRPARRTRVAAAVSPGASVAPSASAPSAAPAPVSAPAPVPTPAVPAPAVPAPAATAPVATTAPAPREERPRSTPPVRKLAKDLGIDLELVQGTGERGLITREDVLAFSGVAAASGGEAAGQASDGGASALTGTVAGGEEAGVVGRETRSPIKGVRKHTAAAMVASAFTAPQVSEFLTVDVTPTMELLARIKADRAFAGLKFTPLTLVAKAVLVALANIPTLNSHWDEAAQEIVQYHYVNLGIAAATPRGLTVPNIKDAHTLSLRDLAVALADLAEKARAARTTPAELSGGTFTITNIGVFGIDAGTPMLYPGEAGILAVGAVRRQPWEYQGEVALRQVLTLSLSFDHRLVDGEQGSRFLADVGRILADPGMVLTMI